jgi:signal transduction histidine kinase
LERRKSTQTPANVYRVGIHDSGPGIPPQYLSKVFEEYTSYFGGSDRSGGGLGLAICRSIIESHDGSIWAENIGGGTTISFVLPYLHERGCEVCSPKKGYMA